MNKPNYLYGIIGLLAGLIIGYIGTDSINKTVSPVASLNNAPAAGRALPPNHPPTGSQATGSQATGSQATGSQATGGQPGAAGSDAGPSSQDGSGQGPQADVQAIIQQAKNNPNDFEAQMKAADLFKQINRPEGALKFYEAAAKARPNDYKLLVLLGNTNFDLKQYEDAGKWYQLALKQNPKDVTVRLDLGSSFYLRSPKDLDHAISEYREALKADPRHEKALQNLTQSLIEKGDKPGARDTLKRLEQVNPGNTSIAQLRSQLE
jgi:tetratricopeptide (TPR) repeat protein